jgi:hypothetical protein
MGIVPRHDEENQMEEQDFFTANDVISEYSRAEAIADGVLVDVSQTAKEAGIRFPCAVTAAAWETCVAWSNADTEAQGVPQDEMGRLWDILMVFRHAARTTGGDELRFTVLIVPRDGRTKRAKSTKLRATCGAGDTLEPVITIMLPDED